LLHRRVAASVGDLAGRPDMLTIREPGRDAVRGRRAGANDRATVRATQWATGEHPVDKVGDTVRDDLGRDLPGNGVHLPDEGTDGSRGAGRLGLDGGGLLLRHLRRGVHVLVDLLLAALPCTVGPADLTLGRVGQLLHAASTLGASLLERG